MKQIEDKVYRRMFRDIRMRTNLLILIIALISATTIPVAWYLAVPVFAGPVAGIFVIALLVYMLLRTRARMVNNNFGGSDLEQQDIARWLQKNGGQKIDGMHFG